MRALWLSFLTILGSGGFYTLYSQDTRSSDVTELQRRVQQLEQLVSRLEQKVNELQTELRKAPSPAPAESQLDTAGEKLQPVKNTLQEKELPLVTVGRDTFSLSSPDKTYRLRIGGHLQLDGKTAFGNNAYYNVSPHQLINNFYMRRARPIFEGSLGKYVDFRFMPDFGNGKSQLYDAYVEIKASPYAVLRGGKFKTPLGLERLQAAADLTFIERSLVTHLVPNRDEGFQISGNVKGRLTYQAAVLNGAPVGQSTDGDNNRGKDLAGRIFLTPFAPSGPAFLKGLGFGTAATTGRQEGASLPSFSTTGGQVVFFSYGSGSGSTAVIPVAAGHRLNYSPQLYYYQGPFGLIAEYAESIQKVSAVVGGNKVMHDIGNYAWQVAGSYVLTGEKKSFKGVVPRKGLDGGKNGLGLGAWEVAARYTALGVDPAVFSAGFADPARSAQSARTWTVGLHWYMNYFMKLQLDYEQTRFSGGNLGDALHPLFSNRPTEKVFSQRLQLAF